MKYRVINTTSKAYQQKVAGNNAAVKLLTIAGFQPIAEKRISNNSSSGGESATADNSSTSSVSVSSASVDSSLELVHSNPAILTLITQKIDAIVSDRKFAKMKSSQSINIGTTTPGV